MSIVVSVVLSFISGFPLKPNILIVISLGGIAGIVILSSVKSTTILLLMITSSILLNALTYGPITTGQDISYLLNYFSQALFAISTVLPLAKILSGLSIHDPGRHEIEEAFIKFSSGFGLIFFTMIVLIPFYVMVMTSLKTQQELLLNPLDFSIDLSKGLLLFRSYSELFQDFGFARYLWTSFYVSIVTVLVTLAFSIPGAYAVARLRFRGSSAFSRSILLIYMVPMIVLALPIYILFSVTGLRNTILGLVLIYPVTTIPVALYMLQGYFRGLPYEIEEAGLMDGLSRLAVIWKITLPLALPALASVSLYVFMIAWNEFLLAFMLLDDPLTFTLTRGVASLNSSEVPRQHLMAGAVISTVPILLIFLFLERFMTKGLTAGSVKG
ncbi:MAG: carbohydrate ABC transporter permease [Rhodobacterales bacterium]|nr:carbohydrate ABC transporter permease [Rhodobacterales bacterium]